MSLASVLQTAYSGMSAASAAVDAVSLNMANSLTHEYQAVHPLYATQPQEMGVEVAGYVTDTSAGPLVATSGDADPDADNGVVERSNTDVGDELVQLILASDAFEANVQVFDTADDLLVDLVHLRRQRW
jgi:flagellar basal-body rod protein FlgC